jgi:uncharacterized DUF497 family protein
MVEFEGFDWDEANLKHATRHGIRREEIEAAFEREWIAAKSDASRGERRYHVVTRTGSGRLIEVVFTLRGERLRPIMAHPVKRSRRRQYEQEI